MSKFKVGITGVGSLLGQGILRSLKQSTLEVTTVGFCVDKYSTGLYWCDESYFIPYAKDSDFIIKLIDAILSSGINVLLVGTDVELNKIAQNKEIIEKRCNVIILISSPFVVELGDDKYKTAKFFIDHNLPAPQSALPSNQNELNNLVKNIGYPLIVKPRKGMRSYGVVIVRNDGELAAAIAITQDPVVQECVGNANDEYTASGIYFNGECNAVIVMRRELRDGNTYRAFTVDNERLNLIVKKWTELVKPYGPINFQFRLDKELIPKVFEINSRFSGTTPLRARAGFNEVEMCLRFLLEGVQVSQPRIKDCMILRHMEETVVEYDESILGGHQT
jgi:carbamoyl-phosphate synthase large subunit